MKRNLICLALIVILLSYISVISAECTDSDGYLTLEESYYVKGNVSVDGSTLPDYCGCSNYAPYSCQLLERICTELNGEMTFGMKYIYCLDGCGDGVCIKGAKGVSETAQTCTSNWVCGVWSQCKAMPSPARQFRNCTDISGCTSPSTKTETQYCNCVENWNCTEWGTLCWPDEQVYRRVCTDVNECGTITNRPALIKSCSSQLVDNSSQSVNNNIPETTKTECKENWNCIEWSNCIKDNQARTCTDSNNCGITTSKPEESKECLIYAGEKKIILDKKDGVNIIESEGKIASTSLDVVTTSEKIYIKSSSGNKELMISPDEAILKAKKIDNVLDVRLEENTEKGMISYTITGTKKAKLFFVFSIEADVVEEINAQTGEVISINKPWWHIFALGI